MLLNRRGKVKMNVLPCRTVMIIFKMDIKSNAAEEERGILWSGKIQ